MNTQFELRKICLSYWKFTHFLQYSSFKDTLLLPKTKFPHKVNPTNRRERDQSIEKATKFEELYEWQRTERKMVEFILHDGPPYANGDVHIGHAVNKILKDITIRHKFLQGHKIHFVPGWDCHGLPIELTVLKNSDKEKKISDLSIRKKAFEFSQKTIEKQRNTFKEWGILAAWKEKYFTCHPDYVTEQLKVFQDLYDEGTIFQDYKPVYWSPSNKTSLAEAELEYNHNHISSSVYVKFKIVECPDDIFSKIGMNSDFSLVIWTTTPWTLPANQAVCYSEDKKYSIVFCKESKSYYIVAEEMVSSLSQALSSDLQLIESFDGNLLKDFKYRHPVNEGKICPVIPGHHVTMTKGTGLVHTAPNHGLDDYLVAKKHNIALDACLVDDNGSFTDDAGSELTGKLVLKDGSEQVLKMIGTDVLCIENYVHSYPYDWRSKTPVILKSSLQWFIDVQGFQDQAMECLEGVKIYPDHLKKAFLNQLKCSPQWCISRQRSWGVPIPAFYAENNTPIVHRNVTNHLCNLVKKHGIHSWWEMDIKDLLPDSLIEKCGLKTGNYRRGTDIMDIWLDSGISWKNVLPEPHVSDVCIEGIDQIRGWFNSSLMTSVALRGKAPYKSLVLHGFTTDADGRKMSKSEGNVVDPKDILNGSKKNKMPAYGIDVLRWWVASHACQHENIALKSQILEECSQNINKLRNVFKFLLGSLNEFNTDEDLLSVNKLRPLDVYMLHLLLHFNKKIFDEYNGFQYKNVSKDIVNFMTNEVSSFYCQLIKDRLYCDPKHSVDQLSCQTTLYFILNILTQCVGAVCPHLAEEVVMHHPNEDFAKKGFFRSTFPSLDGYLDSSTFPTLVALANQIRQAIVKSDIKTVQLDAVIIGSNEVNKMLQNLNTNTIEDSGCLEFFQVASVVFNEDRPTSLPENAQFVNGQVSIEEGKSEPFTIILTDTELKKCPRCRRFSSSTNSLCERCTSAVNVVSKVVRKL